MVIHQCEGWYVQSNPTLNNTTPPHQPNKVTLRSKVYLLNTFKEKVASLRGAVSPQGAQYITHLIFLLW